MTVDISARKEAELALAERNAQFALAAKVALVGSHAYDVDADSMQVDEGYAALHGLPEGTIETTRSQWRLRAHPEDVDRVTCGRRLGKSFLTDADMGGCGHVSGLLVRR
jgi:hypothetical protein